MKKNMVKLVGVVLCVIVIVVCFVAINKESDYERFVKLIDTDYVVPYNDFIKEVKAGNVNTLYYMTNKEYMVYISDVVDVDSLCDYDDSLINVTEYPSGENFRKEMLEYGVTLRILFQPDMGEITVYISMLFTLIFMIVVLIMVRSSFGNISSSDFTVVKDSNIKFDDIIGIDEIIEELKVITEFFKDENYGKDIGAKMSNGILLTGEAGVGKTMIAKAMAHHAGVPFISTSGSDFNELFVGNGARKIRKLFKLARRSASESNGGKSCIIFIDEFDAIGAREDSTYGEKEGNRTITAILKEMDGFDGRERVFVLAATNRPEAIDKAIKRSGRFDRQIEVPAPIRWETRRDLFNKYLSDKSVAPNVDIDSLAKSVIGFTGADIATACNEAAIVALQRGFDSITMSCLDEAVDRRVFNSSKSNQRMSSYDCKVVAYHEAAHAFIAFIIGIPVTRISITPTISGVGGFVFQGQQDSKFKTEEDVLRQIMVCFAGTAVEEVVFNTRTTGAENDIEKATELMIAYCGKYGFDDAIGLVDVSKFPNYDLRAIVSKMSKQIYKQTKDMVSDNIRGISNLGDRLMKVQFMSESDIIVFFGEH